ncbi:DUF934 domain-containing protein [Yangia mangrovi]|uniref:DUF934 domain-containing protein n=1 Tax=Alloyangia mangrovi TaxID=1779329 RepID=A0A2A3JYC8_9RHOB|nr:DUF934 domain-containing protein [Alloyangia mangrovi]MCA0942346.1 DUF934 domain-containing protein [Alloyangia pacifica]MCA0947866.1 DUF934 domain-containing protein [Alloyangia pacifica]MCT4369933.1 DUF934 domain-containing protein [Alloyangia mangrovi]
MTVIVTDEGFGPDSWADQDTPVLDLPSDTDPATLEVPHNAIHVRIAFPSFADGRGFTLARLLRLRGYTGTLRAAGHVISDQYAMARRSGFDEIEISDELAARQPEDEWKFRANWQKHDYQSRVRG